jgi:multiple sugar transport system permease protein
MKEAGARRRPWSVGLDGRILLVPYVAGTVALVVIPALMSFGLSLTDYDLLTPPRFVGLGSFADVFRDPVFGPALANSVLFIVLAVPLRVLGALALALLLNRPRRVLGFYRAAVYVPTVVPDVAYALIWLWILNPLYGPLNLVLAALGFAPPAWLVEPETAKLGFVLMSLFQIGEGFVILLAGLQDVPREYDEAAEVDGATTVQRFRFITLPLLMPWLLLLTFRDIVLSFQYTFVPSYVMTGGDPYYATLFLPLLIYEEAFDRFRFGQGSAMMLLMFLLTVAMVGILYVLLRNRIRAAEEM